MADIKGLICWDIDGVLLRAPSEHYDWRRNLTPLEIQLHHNTVESPEWQDCLCGRKDVGLLLEHHAMELGLSIGAIAHVLHAWHDETIALQEDTLQLLRTMHNAGWHTVIASNQDKARAAWVKMKLDLDDAVHEWFFSCDLGIAKPQLAFYEAIAYKVNLPNLPCVMIDDTISNLDEPKKMGWNTHHFTHYDGLHNFLTHLEQQQGCF